jgi:vancomycin permeability regulator SanA
MRYYLLRLYAHPRRRLAIGLVLLCAILLPVTGSGFVAAATADQRYTVVAEVPQQRVAIVFGAGVRPDGRLTRMLAERVQAASQLYHAGRVQKLLMTGDNSRANYDEVTAMQRHAVQLGVPAEDITLDYAGFSTYESCLRAREIFGVSQAVLVTQRFHLARAVYTCQALGITASGLGTPDWGSYREDLLIRYTLRESLATLKALWEVHVTRPDPTFLGPFEGIASGTRPRRTVAAPSVYT